MFISAATRKNVALGKNTFASSSSVNHQVLVDGDYSDHVRVSDANEWVGVDLGQTEHVDSVQVYFNRTTSKQNAQMVKIFSGFPSVTQRTLDTFSCQIVVLSEWQ